ncbi:hypothetical protein M0802_015286 [Mischocyttarus mexicanus]|nr:hypothetical protein M0802_015286 [Mischocyttarus mexicanus]
MDMSFVFFSSSPMFHLSTQQNHPWVLVYHRVDLSPSTGLSKGVGFIRFDQRVEAERAIQELNGSVPKGSSEPITVKFANNPSNNKAIPPLAYLAPQATRRFGGPIHHPTGRFSTGKAMLAINKGLQRSVFFSLLPKVCSSLFCSIRSLLLAILFGLSLSLSLSLSLTLSLSLSLSRFFYLFCYFMVSFLVLLPACIYLVLFNWSIVFLSFFHLILSLFLSLSFSFSLFLFLSLSLSLS